MNDSQVLSQLRQQLRDELRTTLAGQIIIHKAVAKPILINWKGLKHCLSGTHIEPLRQFRALPRLATLISEATYARYEPDNHSPPRAGVGVHVFYADCLFEDDAFQVWLRIRETPDGLYFYDLGVVKPEN